MNGRTNPREGEYYDYLNQHIWNVKQSWEQFLAPVIQENYPEEYTNCCLSILAHDNSKYESCEFDPYCDYFYPTEECPKDEAAFDRAWLHHQKNNPHHWQYWVLIRDGGEIVPLDMPLAEICAMLSDWHAFSAKDPKSTAYSWYQKNSDKMILSDNTREMVTFLLQYLKEPVKR